MTHLGTRAGGRALLGFCLIAAAAARAQPASSPWPMFRLDAAHTARSGSDTGPSSPALLWSYRTGSWQTSSPALGTAGQVYFGGIDQRLYALGSSGALLWSYETANWMDNVSPAVGIDGTVYFGCQDNVLYAADSAGGLSWSYETGLNIASSPVLGGGGQVYYGSADNRIYSLTPAGALAWSYRTGEAVVSSPALGGDGSVYAGSYDCGLYALDSAGSLAWSYGTANRIESSPSLGAGGEVCIGSSDGVLYRLASSGALSWSYSYWGSWGQSSAAVGSDGRLYYGHYNLSRLFVLDSAGGFVWSYQTAAQMSSSPVLGSDGAVYVGSWDHRLYSLSSAGAMAWSYGTGSSVYASPVLGGGGRMYVASDDFRLYCLGEPPTATPTITPTATPTATPTVTPTPWPWPMFRFDAAHTGRSAFRGPSAPYFEWSYAIYGLSDSSPSVGPRGAVYVGSGDNGLYRMSSAGALDWSYRTAHDIESSPAIGTDGRAYVGSLDNGLYAVDSGGALEWSYRTGHYVYSSPALGSDGSVFFGSYDNALYALGSGGALEWSYRTGHDLFPSPALGTDGRVYFGSFDNALYALGSGGALEWSYAARDDVYSSPALGSGGAVHVTSYDSRLYVLTSLGGLGWSYQSGTYAYSSPALGSDGTAYFGGYDWCNYAISSSGALFWSYRTMGVFASPALGNDGMVYVHSYDQELYALSASGALRWSYRVDASGSANASPAIGSDGEIYLQSSQGTLYRIGEAATPTRTPTEAPVETATPTETPVETATPTPAPPRNAFAAVSCAHADGARGSVCMIDLETNEVSAVIPVGNRPQGLCVTADRAWIYAANSYDATVSAIHTGLKGVVATVAVPSFPRGVRESLDGRSVYVACGEKGGGGVLAVIDRASGTVVREVAVGESPSYGIVEVPGEGILLVGNMASNDISIVDTASWRETGRLRGFKTPVGMLWRDGSLFVANYGAGGLTPSVVRRDYSSVAWVKQWIRPWQIAAFGGSLYVTEYAQDRIAVMDPSTGRIARRIDVGAGPDGIAVGPGGDYLYAANYWSSEPAYGGVGTVSVVDRAGGVQAGLIEVGRNPSQIAVAGAEEEPWPECCPPAAAGLNLCVADPSARAGGTVELGYRMVPGTGIDAADAVLGIELPGGALLAVDGGTGALVPVGSPPDVARIPRMARGVDADSPSEGSLAFDVPPASPHGAYRFVGALLDGGTNRVAQLSYANAFSVD